MGRKSAKQPRNANRRLGDRLWTASGEEFRRMALGSYFADAEQLAAVSAGRRPRYGLLPDHSPITWLDEGKVRQILRRLPADGVLTHDDRVFRPTLWQGDGDELVVLFEEDH